MSALCVICASSFPPSEETPSPQLHSTLNQFLSQVGISSLSSSHLLGLSSLSSGVSLCEECLLLILSAAEWREQVDDLEEGVRSMQTVIVKMMRQISKLMDNYWKEMGRLEERIKGSDEAVLRSKVGGEKAKVAGPRSRKMESGDHRVFQLRDGVVNLVESVSAYRDDLATKLVRNQKIIVKVVNHPKSLEESQPPDDPPEENGEVIPVKLEPHSEDEEPFDIPTDDPPSPIVYPPPPQLSPQDTTASRKRPADPEGDALPPSAKKARQGQSCIPCERWSARQEQFEIKLSGILIGMGNKIEEIRHRFEEGAIAASQTARPPQFVARLPVDLPLQSHSDIDKLEKWLTADKENMEHMIRYCGSFGGDHLGKIVRGMLRKLIGMELAVTINFTGVNNKRSFQVLKLAQVVLEATRLNEGFANETSTAIEQVVMNWFRNAAAALKAVR